MTIDELLFELRQNILHDRSDQVDGTSDQLWADTSLIRYIDEAQRRLARNGLVIRDGTTTSCTQVTLVTGQTQYTLHKAVIGVLSARLTTDVADLARAGHNGLDTYRQPDTYFFDPSQLSTLVPGKPLAYTTDEYLVNDASGSSGVVSLRIYPEPTATYNGQTIRLRVVRMPIYRLIDKLLTDSPEVPEDFHIPMLDWAAHLALRIVDLDAGVPQRAAEFRQSFEVMVQEARTNSMRKLFAPAIWGFGRNGFSWQGNNG